MTQGEGTKAYVFDAYGTLFDVHSAAERLADEIGENWSKFSQAWRAKQLQYTWVRALAGRHKPFHAVTEDALEFAAASVGGIAEVTRKRLLDAYMTLDAYGEVPRVLGALKERNCKLAILSNGSPEMLSSAVDSAGIADLLDACLSIEEVGIYKPAPRVYQLACDRFHVSPHEISFQSSNRWDVAGAKSFGFYCVWINRFGQADEFFDLPADRVVTSLDPLLDNQEMA